MLDMPMSRTNPKRPRTDLAELVENAVNASNQASASESSAPTEPKKPTAPVKPAAPRTAATLKHLAGYVDAARPGGLTFGDDHETVKYPTSVFAIDDAIEAVKAAKSCAVCEEPGCTEKATHGANHPSANPRRCHRHREKAGVPVLCSHAGCVEKNPLVRVSSDPDGPAICLWHALATKTPASYKFVRGVKTCTCGKKATFGIGKSQMTCGPCASVVNRHLSTELTNDKAGNCARCGERVGHDTATRAEDDVTVKVCRTCYLEIEVGGKDSGFKPGTRCHACYKAGCKKRAKLKKTVNGKTTVSCPEHAKGDTAYKHIHRPCREKNCRQQALYAANFGVKPVACGDHKKKTEFNVVQPRCRACLATQLHWYDATIVKKRGGLCKDCDQEGGGPVVRFYEKTIVSAIVSKLRDTGNAFDAVLDTAINMHASNNAFRPDLVLRFDTKTVFVEVDEQQHGSYDCERRREAAIFSSVADLEREKLMVRINPDAGGAAFALFTKKPTVVELVDHGDAAFTTPRFDEKLAEVVDICTKFVAGELQPGHIHHINWTIDAPPRPIQN